MNILFLSLGVFYDLSESSVHLDILKRFAMDHDVWLVCKNEGKPTEYIEEYGVHVLRVHTGELKKVNLLKKGINTILVESQFKNAIKRYISEVSFDLILYTTPPITFANVVKYIKKRDHAISYLMLKDIFPQNAVDLGILSRRGIKGIIYSYFRKKEKQLYQFTDYFGCMSPANCKYLLANNPEIDSTRVDVCPNITVINDVSIDSNTRTAIRSKYGIPLDKRVFVYGGNLGKPQGIPFVIECLKAVKSSHSLFLIIGKGTEYNRLQQFIETEQPPNCLLMESLPKEDYETLVAACDVGMVFLDHRFTIPNFPSRILSYMKARLPVLAVTDPNTDMGTIIESAGFGWWCESNDIKGFSSVIDSIEHLCIGELNIMGNRGFDYMVEHYNPDVAYSEVTSKCYPKANQIV